MIDLRDPEERSAAAGEYVLGTLGDEDRRAVEAVLAQEASAQQASAQDKALLAEVYDWQDRLLGLSSRAPSAEPGPQLWQRIDSTLNAIGAAAPAARRDAPAARLPWWRRAAPWQGISALALAACLLMAVLLVQRPPGRDAAAARYLAVLQSPQDSATGWIVEIEAGRGLRLVPVAATAAVPAGRSLQFWTKLQGADGPTSLGLVTAGRTLELPLSRLPGVGEQQLFEITLEPQNGSPIGRPTGPILYLGRSVPL